MLKISEKQKAKSPKLITAAASIFCLLLPSPFLAFGFLLSALGFILSAFSFLLSALSFIPFFRFQLFAFGFKLSYICLCIFSERKIQTDPQISTLR
ncbi:hypothetical protein [Mucilaginibacter sp.]|uniref:hypothetical protein n=1 Tax=Mucilaginibacter sp. TaxID=1882438 RepID=UPI002615BA47|nr:hypothetical protein [Mucilaginibacter sp.]